MSEVGDLESALADGGQPELRTWLRLLTCSTLIEQHVRRHLRRRFATTLPRFDMLAQLDRGRNLTMSELSHRLMVTNGNVTGLIDRLVKEGLVSRSPAPDDRRSQMVRLTNKGQCAFDAMLPIHNGWIEDLIGGLEQAEMKQLLALLAKLKRSLINAKQTGDMR